MEYIFKKKYNLVETTLKNLIQKKKLDMGLLVGQCLKDVHLIKKKINLIITEEKVVLKYDVKNWKESAMEITDYEKKEKIPLNQ